MPTGSEAFLELPIALGYGSATGPTLKTTLCHIRTLVGRRINTARVHLTVSPSVPIGRRSRQVFKTASSIPIQLMYVVFVRRLIPKSDKDKSTSCDF